MFQKGPKIKPFLPLEKMSKVGDNFEHQAVGTLELFTVCVCFPHICPWVTVSKFSQLVSQSMSFVFHGPL